MWTKEVMGELLSILGWQGGTHTQIKEEIKVSSRYRLNKVGGFFIKIGKTLCFIIRYKTGATFKQGTDPRECTLDKVISKETVAEIIYILSDRIN